MVNIEEILNDEKSDLELKECVDFKEPKNYLKAVSSFSNSFDVGYIIFGIQDGTKEIIGIDDVKKSVEEIELDIDKDKSIITVGRLEKDKGYDLFLKTFSSVTKKDDKIIWYIIGNDNTEYAKWFKKQIE